MDHTPPGAHTIGVIVEQEGVEDTAVTVDAGACVTDVVAAACVQLQLTHPPEAYEVVVDGVDGVSGATGNDDAPLDVDVAVADGSRVLLRLAVKYIAREKLRARGVYDPARAAAGTRDDDDNTCTLDAWECAQEQRDAELLELFLQADVIPRENVEEACCVAVRWGEGDLLEMLLQGGVAAAGPNILLYAATEGQWAMWDLLRRKGAGYARKQHRDMALLLAMRRGAWEAVRILLREGADPNARRPLAGGTTCLTSAAHAAAWHVVADLIAFGAAIDARDFFWHNALTIAARKGQWGALCDLVTCGGDPHCSMKVCGEETPLTAAAAAGALDAVRHIIEHAPDKATPERVGACMLSAAGGGHVAIIDYLATSTGSPEAHSVHVQRALGVAIGHDHGHVVEHLLASGVDPNAMYYNGDTALTLAVKRGDDTIVAALLDAGAAVNARNSDGDSSVMIAGRVPPAPGVGGAPQGQGGDRQATGVEGAADNQDAVPSTQHLTVSRRRILRLLCDNGADMAAVGRDKKWYVVALAEHGAWCDIEYLVGIGCDVATCEVGGAPLALAAAAQQQWGAVHALLRASATNTRHHRAWWYACVLAALKTDASGDDIMTLLEHAPGGGDGTGGGGARRERRGSTGASVCPIPSPLDAPSPGADSLITTAAALGRWDLVTALAERGAAVDYVPDSGAPCLVAAAAAGAFDMVDTLLTQHAADPAVQHRDTGETYAHAAARAGAHEVIAKLLSADKCLEVLATLSKQRVTVVAAAAQAGAWHIVDLLTDALKRLDVKKLTAAEEEEERKRAAASLRRTSSMSERDEQLMEAMLRAVKAMRTGEVLSDDSSSEGRINADDTAGRDVQIINIADTAGVTVLHLAASAGEMSIVRAVLDAGADVTAVDARGTTVALAAAAAGHWDVVEHLVRAGADAEAEDWQGESCLTAASDDGCLTEFARFLVDLPPR